MRPSQLLLAAAAVGSVAFATEAVAQAEDMAKWKPAMCGTRVVCAITEITTAGRGAVGAALAVAKVRLGFEDKSPDAPDAGCIKEDSDERDGGIEYWLIEGNLWPRQIFRLCNDGYGASGVGEDKIEIGDNSLTHTQSGGSNDRWRYTRVIQLSPPRTTRLAGCTFLASDPLVSTATETDVAAMTTRVVAIDDQQATDEQRAQTKDGFVPCPEIGNGWAAEPAPGLLAGLAIPLPEARDYPAGTLLGACALHIGSDARPGFLVFGAPDPQRRPELWLAALNRQTLVVQVYEPKPAPSATSWVASDHLEVWTTSFDPELHNRPNPQLVKQVGIGLDGAVHRGIGNPALPKVRRWEGHDQSGRPVTVLVLRWPDKDALSAGVSVVYSQAENGRQARLVATAGIVKNRPSYLPALQDIPVRCGVADGRWDVVANAGSLAPPN
jgi:hypothetical protein